MAGHGLSKRGAMVKGKPPSFDRDTTRRNIRKGRAKPKNISCAICKEKFRVINSQHLAKHGYTLERYRRVYCQPTKAPDIKPGEAMMKAVGEELLHRPAFLHSVADEVEQAMAQGPLKQQVANSIGLILANRGALLATATENLTGINNELAQPWRREQGGDEGGPTKTSDLVAMGHLAHAQVVKAEDAFIKAAKLLVELNPAGQEDETSKYSGQAEKLNLSKDIGAGDREILRTLFTRLRSGSPSKEEIIVEVKSDIESQKQKNPKE